MTFLVHLSDLHIARGKSRQTRLFERLVATVEREHERARPEHSTIIVTGDVFDSATDPAAELIETFLALNARLQAVAGNARTVVLPGNHDRRRFGWFGPNREHLFRELHRAADPSRVHVLGQRTPFLAEVVPADFHRLPAHVVAYDSSYLPGGYIGAGGTFRLEDLLQVHAQLPDDGKPLVVLVHHHLIPTPVTDISHIDMVGTPRFVRWLVRRVLPALVSYADHEELTMTALGAGTALSALHTFGRAVLLLHGHKHVPTARIVRGLGSDCGDVVLASAGSGGRSESVYSSQANAAPLWPSFNLVDLAEQSLRVEALSFSPKHSNRPATRRDLVRATRRGARWTPEPITFEVSDAPPRVQSDEASYTLSLAEPDAERWDFECERRVTLVPGAKLARYKDIAHALPSIAPGRRPFRRAYRRVVLAIDEPTRYRAPDALCRTLAEAERRYGKGSAFEWVGLLCRYGAESATLRLALPAGATLVPFASATDLTTGRERPVRVTHAEGRWSVELSKCVPRTLIRIYWPLR